MLDRPHRLIEPFRERRHQNFRRRDVHAFIDLQTLRFAHEMKHWHRLSLQRSVFVVTPVEQKLRLPNAGNEVDPIRGGRVLHLTAADAASNEHDRTIAIVESGDEHAWTTAGAQSIQSDSRVIDVRP